MDLQTHQHSLIREIKEELDSDITVDSYVMTVKHDYPTFHITMHCYMCTLVIGNLTLSEHNDSVWLEKDKILELDWAEADMSVVMKIIE